MRAELEARFPKVKGCLGGPQVKNKLTKSLRWAVANAIPVLTPQLFVREKRMCDEDTRPGPRVHAARDARGEPRCLKGAPPMNDRVKMAVLGLAAALVPAGLVASWGSAAGARLHENQSKPAPVSTAAVSDDAYCTPQLKAVVRRVAGACGLLSAAGGARGCQPMEAQKVAALSGGDFNALFRAAGEARPHHPVRSRQGGARRGQPGARRQGLERPARGELLLRRGAREPRG